MHELTDPWFSTAIQQLLLKKNRWVLSYVLILHCQLMLVRWKCIQSVESFLLVSVNVCLGCVGNLK